MASPVATNTDDSRSVLRNIRKDGIHNKLKDGRNSHNSRTDDSRSRIHNAESVPVVTVTWADVDINLCGRFRWRNRQSKGGGTHNHSQRIFHRLAPFGETLRG